MARMHSRVKGKSGSTRPSEIKIPSWMGYKAKEVELLIGKLGKDGMTASRIGLHMRDNYGIPDVKLVAGKSITSILKEKKQLPLIPEDLRALIRKSMIVRKHLEGNNKDEPARRGLQLTESKIKRLVKYYLKSDKLPTDWKYDPRKASTYIE
ncbi:MAG: 30S ribosomal protein S15 [Candidatus Nanoarchaeia archaeon]